MDAEKNCRMGAIDAARGFAMLLVFLAHFCDGYCPHLGDAGAALEAHVTIVTYAASPTFMLLSGMTLGLLRVSHGPRLGKMRSRLIDRGLFLLLVGHPLILAGVFPWLKPGQATRMFFITDTIGLCVAGGAFFSPWLAARARLLLGLLLVVGSWAGVVLLRFEPTTPLRVIKDWAFGPWGESTLAYNFPLLPWAGVYLVGSALGEAAGRLRGTPERLERLLVALAGAGFGLCALLKIARRALQAGGRDGELLTALTTLQQKLPPGLFYLMFYGSAALVLAAALVRAERLGSLRWVRARLEMLGRASLAAFLLQFYVYYTLVYELALPMSRAWPLFFAASVALQWPLLQAWDARGLNRWLTLRRRLPVPPATLARAH